MHTYWHHGVDHTMHTILRRVTHTVCAYCVSIPQACCCRAMLLRDALVVAEGRSWRWPHNAFVAALLVRACAREHACMCVHVCRTCARASLCMHTCMHAYQQACMHAHMRTFAHACVCVCLHTRAHACMRRQVRSQIDSRANTYAHTCMRACACIGYLMHVWGRTVACLRTRSCTLSY